MTQCGSERRWQRALCRRGRHAACARRMLCQLLRVATCHPKCAAGREQAREAARVSLTGAPVGHDDGQAGAQRDGRHAVVLKPRQLVCGWAVVGHLILVSGYVRCARAAVRAAAHRAARSLRTQAAALEAGAAQAGPAGPGRTRHRLGRQPHVVEFGADLAVRQPVDVLLELFGVQPRRVLQGRRKKTEIEGWVGGRAAAGGAAGRRSTQQTPAGASVVQCATEKQE